MLSSVRPASQTISLDWSLFPHHRKHKENPRAQALFNQGDLGHVLNERLVWAVQVPKTNPARNPPPACPWRSGTLYCAQMLENSPLNFPPPPQTGPPVAQKKGTSNSYKSRLGPKSQVSRSTLLAPEPKLDKEPPERPRKEPRGSEKICSKSFMDINLMRIGKRPWSLECPPAATRSFAY